MPNSVDLIDPFLTFYRAHPDHNDQDARAETQLLFERQGAIEDFIEGKAQADEVLDRLEEQGIDAAAYVDSVCEQVEAIIDGGIIYVTNESGLLIPQGMLI